MPPSPLLCPPVVLMPLPRCRDGLAVMQGRFRTRNCLEGKAFGKAVTNPLCPRPVGVVVVLAPS